MTWVKIHLLFPWLLRLKHWLFRVLFKVWYHRCTIPNSKWMVYFRLADGSNEDLLSHSQSIYDNLTPLSTYFHKLCTCDGGETTCSYKKYTNCETNIRGTEIQCILHSSPRKKRDLLYTHDIKESKQPSDTTIQVPTNA
jgi:hypothetical protein